MKRITRLVVLAVVAAGLGVHPSAVQQSSTEGHGVDPDLVVDNLPHATFEERDAQLEAAIAELQAEIKAHPIPSPKVPAYPKKSGGS